MAPHCFHLNKLLGAGDKWWPRHTNCNNIKAPLESGPKLLDVCQLPDCGPARGAAMQEPSVQATGNQQPPEAPVAPNTEASRSSSPLKHQRHQYHQNYHQHQQHQQHQQLQQQLLAAKCNQPSNRQASDELQLGEVQLQSFEEIKRPKTRVECGTRLAADLATIVAIVGLLLVINVSATIASNRGSQNSPSEAMGQPDAIQRRFDNPLAALVPGRVSRPAIGSPRPGNIPSAATIDWTRIGAQFRRQFADYRRWSNRPNNHEIRDQYRYPRRGFLMRTLDGIRSRIGARNTIRVHNAFRDFAWRILSDFSMPTPVIYELRRQHFYSPEEDLMNDSLHNKNTTRTIRTRRLLGTLWPAAKKANLPAELTSPDSSGSNYLALWLQADRLASKWLNSLATSNKVIKSSSNRRSSRDLDDDDDEPENFRERLRMRLDDLISLSRRSLFGRVVRLPAIFPFKRQEEDNNINKDDDESEGGKSSRLSLLAHRSGRGGGRFRQGYRRRKTDQDRQMITINGKQYFVDDDGELKELKGGDT